MIFKCRYTEVGCNCKCVFRDEMNSFKIRTSIAIKPKQSEYKYWFYMSFVLPLERINGRALIAPNFSAP